MTLPTSAPARPEPPRGPGVTPPFAAPPTDGLRRRMWIGLAAGAVALIVCCVGGVGGFIALGVTAEQARANAATKVVTDYLTAWQHGDYPAAYKRLCARDRRQQTLEAFAGDLSSRPLTDFTVGKPDLRTNVTFVPVTLSHADGRVQNDSYPVTVNRDGRSEVCL